MVKLTSPSQVMALLQERGLQPNSLLGQNFLIDGNVRDIIITAANPQPDDVILEIGPGLGVLTERLSALSARLVAVEKDHALCEHLRGEFADTPCLKLIEGDALDIDQDFIQREGITKVVSNLPYSVGSRVLMNLFSLLRPPAHITVMVQLEVAQRLAAGSGDEDRGLLGVWAQRVYSVRTVKVVSPNCFYPRPQVKSAVVVLERLPMEFVQKGDRALFRELTKGAFSFRRKQMATIMTRLSAKLGITGEQAVSVLTEVGLDPRIRPEMLTVDQWHALADGLRKYRI
jgi:16S rRNA (adenine1518-N6/adenine1519-N6)-dimethyltransferase